MITLENSKLVKYLSDKEALVNEGRKVSGEIEKIEAKISICENKEKKITGSVKPPIEMVAEGNKLSKDLKVMFKRLEEIGNNIEKNKLEAIPADLKKEHMDLLKAKEELERNRNKIALKVQKIKDRVIPIVQTECKPLLKEYDDIETAKLKNGKVIIETFNHLVEWQKSFRKR